MASPPLGVEARRRRSLFLESFVTLQLGISGSGALPVPRAFAMVGVRTGLGLCFIAMLLNKVTSEWLLVSACETATQKLSYSALCKKAGFGVSLTVLVEIFTLTLMTGSYAACLAALRETSGRAVDLWCGGGSQIVRDLTPAAGILLAAVAGAKDYEALSSFSTAGVAFLLGLVACVVGAFINAGPAADSADMSLRDAPAAVATLGYSFYVAPLALSVYANELSSTRFNRADLANIVKKATALTFMTTFVVYGLLGTCGALWLGSRTPGDVATAFTDKFIAPATALYLAVSLLPMFHPLQDSANAIVDLYRKNIDNNHQPKPTTETEEEEAPPSQEQPCVARLLAVCALVVAAMAARCDSIAIFAFTGATGVCVTCYVVPVVCFWRIVLPARRRRASLLLPTIDQEDETQSLVDASSSTSKRRCFDVICGTFADVVLPFVALFFGCFVSFLSLILALDRSHKNY